MPGGEVKHKILASHCNLESVIKLGKSLLVGDAAKSNLAIFCGIYDNRAFTHGTLDRPAAQIVPLASLDLDVLRKCRHDGVLYATYSCYSVKKDVCAILEGGHESRGICHVCKKKTTIVLQCPFKTSHRFCCYCNCNERNGTGAIVNFDSCAVCANRCICSKCMRGGSEPHSTDILLWYAGSEAMVFVIALASKIDSDVARLRRYPTPDTVLHEVEEQSPVAASADSISRKRTHEEGEERRNTVSLVFTVSSTF